MKKLQLFLMGFILCFSVAGLLSAHDAFAEPGPADASQKVGGVESLEDRVEALEKTLGEIEPTGKWFERIAISGLVEVEASYSDDEDTSDVDLAAAELNTDAKIADQVDGHVKIKYEDDDLFIDEGFITLTGPERLPAYLIAGRQYLPFGNFETHFVTDPNTLILGETDEGAVVVGYCIGEELLDITVGAFNGRAQKAGDNDTIDSFVAAIRAHPFEGLSMGVSYTSNLAGSDSFNEQAVDPDNLDSLVGAWSAFVTYEFLERFRLIGEYVGALDSFKTGEIYDAGDTKEREPSAWNVELGMTLMQDVSAALRYGGSDDGSAFLPETQYGAVVNWGLFKNTNLALEYLHSEFEDDYQDIDTITAQLAIEF